MPAEDIKNLFSRFGNRSGQYREIVREEQTVESIERWPLLSTVEANRMRDIPGVSHAPAVARPVPASAPLPTPIPSAVAPAPQSPLIVKVAAAPVATQTMASPAAHFSAAAAFTRAPATSPTLASPEVAQAPSPSPLSLFASAPAAVAPTTAVLPAAAQATPSAAVSSGRPFPTFEGSAHQPLSAPSASLNDMFGRLAGPQTPDPAAADSRPLPAFRRLRRS
jgi:hypothetical protein